MDLVVAGIELVIVVVIVIVVGYYHHPFGNQHHYHWLGQRCFGERWLVMLLLRLVVVAVVVHE